MNIDTINDFLGIDNNPELKAFIVMQTHIYSIIESWNDDSIIDFLISTKDIFDYS